MLGPEIGWNPANAPPPGGRVALTTALPERHAATTAPLGAAPTAGLSSVSGSVETRCSVLHERVARRVLGVADEAGARPQHRRAARGVDGDGGLARQAGGENGEIAVPVGVKSPPGARSFASIAVMLGVSVFRAQTTVAWPPSPTATSQAGDRRRGGAVARAAEIGRREPKSPLAPVRTAARTTCASPSRWVLQPRRDSGAVAADGELAEPARLERLRRAGLRGRRRPGHDDQRAALARRGSSRCPRRPRRRRTLLHPVVYRHGDRRAEATSPGLRRATWRSQSSPRRWTAPTPRRPVPSASERDAADRRRVGRLGTEVRRG